jgi:hypothetical protein
MIEMRFKDYLEAKPSFDRLFKNTAATVAQAAMFESLAEATMDAFMEYSALQAQVKKSEGGEQQDKLIRELREFSNSLIKAEHEPVSGQLLDWLKLSIEDFVYLKRHRVIKD